MREKQSMKSPAPRRRRRGQQFGIAALALALVALGACEEGALTDIDGDGDPDDLGIESLVITAAEDALVEGGTSHFQAQARAAADVPVDTATITWTSRDETVATVGASTGTVTAVMQGETYIVAQTGAGDAVLTDSVLLTVAMPALTGVGQTEIRIRGDDFTESYSWNEDTGELYSGLVVEESMGGDEHNAAYMDFEHDVNGDDAGFFVAFPRTGAIQTGTLDLVALDPALIESDESVNDALTGPAAVFIIEQANSDLIYASVEGTLTIESVSAQPGYTSAESEEVMGRFEMTAEGYILDYDTEEITATGETVRITGLFGVEYLKEMVPYATVSITSDGTEIDLGVTEADLSRFENELTLSTYGEDADGKEWWTRTRVIDPATGTFPIADLNGNYEATFETTNVYGDRYDYDEATETGEYVELYSAGGTLVIDQFIDAPAPDGVIEATVTVDLDLYQDGVFTGEQVQADIYVIAPAQEEDEAFFRASTTADRDSGIRGILRSQRAPAQNREDRIR